MVQSTEPDTPKYTGIKLGSILSNWFFNPAIKERLEMLKAAPIEFYNQFPKEVQELILSNVEMVHLGDGSYLYAKYHTSYGIFFSHSVDHKSYWININNVVKAFD
jgi:hypothetical protein